MPTVGRLIAGARITAGLTQEELARQVNVHENTVRNWEADKFLPRANRLREIALATGQHVSYFGVVRAGILDDPRRPPETHHPGVEALLADAPRRRALEITDQEAQDLRAIYLGPGRRVDQLDDAVQFLLILRRLQVPAGPDE
jgi:transcriptional regulator with XRE-family HTH domain